MPDVSMRFHKDMLVLSAPVVPALARVGVDVARDLEFTLLLEPDTFEDAYRLEGVAGAQCVVAPTASFTPARLARVRMEDRAEALVDAAFAAVSAMEPQHVLAEVAPCGLPLDASSKASLNESRDQYMRAGRLLNRATFDAFFLNGFTSCADLKCALMGLRAVSDRPVFVSVDVDASGVLANGRDTLGQAVSVMVEYEAAVVGLCTAAAPAEAAALAVRMARVTTRPLLVQLEVGERGGAGGAFGRGAGSAEAAPYGAADAMVPAAEALRAAGVQFLRAAGNATPAYAGALVAATMGLDAASLEVREAAAACAADAEGDAAAAPSAVASGASAGNVAAAEAVVPAELVAFVERARAQVAEALEGNLSIVENDGPAID